MKDSKDKPVKEAEETLNEFVVFTDDEKDIQQGQLKNVLQAMEQYRNEGLKEELWKFEIADKGLKFCIEHKNMIHNDIDNYLKQKGLPL